MTSYKPGDVVAVPFPFSDLSGAKKRPALVLAVAERNQELVCVMLTSVSRGGALEQPIVKWKEAGLLKPTVAKIHRIFTISSLAVTRKIGQLNSKELMLVIGKLLRFFIASVNGFDRDIKGAPCAIRSVYPVEERYLILEFEDGAYRVVDIKPLMVGSMFEPLKEKAFFRQVKVDSETGDVAWPNGASLDPDVLRAKSVPLILPEEISA